MKTEEKLKKASAILRNESYALIVMDGGQTRLSANVHDDRSEALTMLGSLNSLVKLITDKHPILKK